MCSANSLSHPITVGFYLSQYQSYSFSHVSAQLFEHEEMFLNNSELTTQSSNTFNYTLL